MLDGVLMWVGLLASVLHCCEYVIVGLLWVQYVTVGLLWNGVCDFGLLISEYVTVDSLGSTGTEHIQYMMDNFGPHTHTQTHGHRHTLNLFYYGCNNL